MRRQLDKLFRHVNQGSIETRYRYFEATDRFCQFVAERFRLQKFENVQGKHLIAYLQHMQEKGLRASTIKTDLSAIRFFHDQTNSRYELPDNKAIGQQFGASIERRHFGQIARAWSDSEYRNALELTAAQGKPQIGRLMEFARVLGLRLHETTRLTTPILRKALNDGYLTIKGKGGLVRNVPLTGTSRIVIQKTLQEYGRQRQSRLFVGPSEKAHQVNKQVENWVYTHRDRFTEGEVRLTFHGLRHAYAQERYSYHLQREGGDEKAARMAVSRELGHGRDEVTRIYLAK
ncbi:tyrosine-type recombinase/integrase [Alicyclobacillus ferrooxydans]|uniref:tyrosine-type recombinase/integrase n=1 Tax=Alicyclobacillus ferrooxydans TaxID=471514 RepID=UPI00147011E9|nr:tyrosine-type recombinase/integrase [Alicyclobacillus ferrooxydans]